MSAGMIPVLFPATETRFETQGIGVLSDTISCTVQEGLNEIYELEMQYPMGGLRFEEIKNRNLLYTIPSPYRLPQPFRIYRITKPLNGICTIYAKHISYDLSGIPLNPFTANSAPQAMLGLKTNAAVESPFTFWTNKSTVANFAVSVPSSTRSVLGGQAGSVLDAYGGEYEWDNFSVKLHTKRGSDNGVTIRYGKNLTDIEQDANISNLYTGIYPYWTDSEGNLVTCEPKIIYAPGTYDFEKILPADFSQDFGEKPTPEQLKARGDTYIKANRVGVPEVSMSVKFVQLEQTEEYKHLALLEKCDLGDTVTVQFAQLGVDVKARIVKTKTDCLTGRYIEVNIGQVRSTIADTIAGQQQEISKKPSSSQVEWIADQIAATIMGAKGGAVRLLDTNDDGMPDTLFIADNPAPEKAKKVWRFNFEGWGASSTGYNGPFTMAASIDFGLYADFITAGVINAALIKAGILSSKDGKSFWNFDTGQIQLNGVFSAIDAAKNILSLSAGQLLLQDQDGNARVRLYRSNDYYGGVLRFEGTKYYAYATSDGIGIREFENPGTIGPTDPIVFDANYNGNVIAGNSVNTPRLNGNLISYKYSEELQAWVVVIDSTKTQSPKLFSGVVNVEN